ncbi:MAG TPA: hypothetical protein VJ482_11740 [Acidimicrobiia bacterium]|nr:hypothetical protein [Acidimicrobiia bacterium]
MVATCRPHTAGRTAEVQYPATTARRDIQSHLARIFCPLGHLGTTRAQWIN